ncbi:Cof-type HAD-IIB family hydrolase [Sporolactobacillus sp. Y61]|uniref:Cof-type HAD-IIB family hydrolase n=1 Tax=Sporolactobacillus sp. Y61 TaxID=3160863 RepID=A0AAU8ICJ7_9BACL|nr:Cof-type HAD-IIB family hydrolase [Sporolactobacillus sp. THM19-2]RYL92836.1 Cof-type HAD-IIB family hydrolase [Sporolactobacillus sp. THM19-2]
MSNIKIVFFDIDSTLYDRQKKVPASAAAAIETLQRRGIKTVIATGRAPFMFGNLRSELDIHSYVSLNGSYVVFNDRPLYKNPLTKKILDQLEAESSERDHRLIFVNEKTMKIDGKLSPVVKEGFSSLKLNLPFPEQDPDFYKHADVYQALLFYNERDNTDYLKRAPLNTFRYVRWHREAVDVIPRSGSKASGIKTMLEKLGIAPDEACAFGDGHNDVEMLSFVGTGVAMGNAVDEAKEAASFITERAEQDGIATGLKHLDLI